MTQRNGSLGTFVRRVSTEQTGGGVMVDVVELDDGSVLTISEDVIILRPSLSSWHDREDEDALGEIERPELGGE